LGKPNIRQSIKHNWRVHASRKQEESGGNSTVERQKGEDSWQLNASHRLKGDLASPPGIEEEGVEDEEKEHWNYGELENEEKN